MGKARNSKKTSNAKETTQSSRDAEEVQAGDPFITQKVSQYNLGKVPSVTIKSQLITVLGSS